MSFFKLKISFNLFLQRLRNFILNINNDEIIAKQFIGQLKDYINNKNLPSYILKGYQVYSQNDEDGIIQAIFEDIGLTNKFFIEIGSGDGLENNTHFLLLNDWNGIWIDSNKKYINKLNKLLPINSKLVVDCKKINPSNINTEINYNLKKLDKENIESIDFFSIDIDSIDIHCVNNLSILRPRLICIEYNSKFPPNIEISVDEKFDQKWAHDDYMGASLSFITKCMEEKNYKLISTNITGSNSFFVDKNLYDKCITKDQSIMDLYMPPNYHLYSSFFQGHKSSFKFLVDKLKE